MSTVESLPIDIRETSENDKNYILSTWLSSYRKSRWVEGVESPVYYERQRKVIEGLLGSCNVLVASWREDARHVYGWICYGGGYGRLVVHYAYVGEKYRRLGIGGSLLGAVPWYKPNERIIATHYSNILSPILEPKFKIENDPYLLKGYSHEDY